MSRMYGDSIQQINPLVGCEFDCRYCAFKRFMTRGMGKGKTCSDCKTFTPHTHMERLVTRPKKTQGNEFISVCLNGDISFASGHVIDDIISYCQEWSDRTFLIQSKDPARFLDFEFPDNVILGTTIETDDDELYAAEGISKAPSIRVRVEAMEQITSNRKMVTIEPILEFDMARLLWMLIRINPDIVYIGYDSKPALNRLYEPAISKVMELADSLRTSTDVRLKLIRQPYQRVR